jgi:pimeloyl-ACP methyl ester carboxylesterase
MDGWSQPVMKAYLAAAAATDTASWWTAGLARVLIIQGLADVSAPPENGRLLKQEIGNRAALIELPGIGHALAVEDPGAVAAVIVAQLGLRNGGEA